MELQHAVWLASIFGPFLVIMGLWMLFYHENMNKIMASIKGCSGCFYVLGIINLLIGLTIISRCNIWEWNAAVLVTLLGWFLILRGVFSLFIPQVLMKWTMGKGVMKGIGLLPLVWGALMSWFAFS